MQIATSFILAIINILVSSDVKLPNVYKKQQINGPVVAVKSSECVIKQRINKIPCLNSFESSICSKNAHKKQNDTQTVNENWQRQRHNNKHIQIRLHIESKSHITRQSNTHRQTNLRANGQHNIQTNNVQRSNIYVCIHIHRDKDAEINI